MKKTFLTLLLIPLLVAGFSAASAHASLFEPIVHDYGEGQVDPGGIDELFNGYVKVSTAPASANRFTDSFDLSGLNYSSIDSFKLSLTVSDTDGFWEDWRLRPGGSNTAYYRCDMVLDSVGENKQTLSFTIDEHLDSLGTFASMVEEGEFFYWFADQGWHTFWDNDFKLYDATLEVCGTPTATPIPGAAWLLGSGLVGLVGIRRRMKA